MTTVVGVIGGIGSGKSTVSGLLRDLGAAVIDADALAHQALDDPALRAAIAARFGSEVLDDGGRVIREKLAARVFGPENEAARRDLNAIIHPPVRERIRAMLADGRREGRRVVVLDVPLLLESPFRGDCDEILLIRADLDSRRARTAGRGWKSGELEARESAQSPMEKKLEAATAIIDNDGDLNVLRTRVEDLFRTWSDDESES